MLRKWLDFVNIAIFAFLAILLIAAISIEWGRSGAAAPKEVREKKRTHPAMKFAQKQEIYDLIGEPVLSLEYQPPRMQLPDLRQQINYYGQNSRPDASADSSLLHFTLANSQEMVSIPPNESLYLVYNKDDGMGNYHFSPNNKETSLWMTGTPGEKEVAVEVRMRDEKGDIVVAPEVHAQFQVKEKEFARFGGKPWEIGKWRVDGTLLARQHARWHGIDKFLERHGGEEFQEWVGKNRIDFNDKEEAYSVYVGEGSVLIWDDEHWKAVKPGKDSRGLPLLVVKKIDERLMNLELWDPDGKKKVALNLLKSMETWLPKNVQQDFKFLGARTRSQFVFEVDDEKMLLSPNDWLLLTEEGWRKLGTPEEIDDYVQREEIGTLFVFDGVQRVGDQQILHGAIYNASRTQVHDVELPVQKDGLVFEQVENGAKKRIKNGIKEKDSPASYANSEGYKQVESD